MRLRRGEEAPSIKILRISSPWLVDAFRLASLGQEKGEKKGSQSRSRIFALPFLCARFVFSLNELRRHVSINFQVPLCAFSAMHSRIATRNFYFSISQQARPTKASVQIFSMRVLPSAARPSSSFHSQTINFRLLSACHPPYGNMCSVSARPLQPRWRYINMCL